MTGRVVTAVAFLWLSAAVPAAADTVRVAHPAQLAPFIYVQDGKTVGLAADILRAAATREGIAIVFVPESPAQLRTTLTDGTADAIAPAPIIPGRYVFTSAFLVTGGGLFVRAPKPTPSGLTALSGNTVITPEAGPFVSFIKQNFPNVKVVSTNKSTSMTSEYLMSLDQVVRGQADAAALNIQEGAWVVAESFAHKITVPTRMFTQLSLGLAATGGRHADLLKRFDAGFAAIRADGTLRRIEAKWSNAH
ncbi:MAG TPA: transporter substrate-binding domain-containing protein [Candidatus Eremiobacteraceae bacterium]